MSWLNKLRLKSKNPEARRRAVDALGAIDEPWVHGLLANCLGDDDREVRTAAAKILATGKKHPTRQILLSSLGHARAEVREAAAVGLGHTGDSCFGSTLFELLTDAHASVRAAAAEALRRLAWKPANREQQAAFDYAAESDTVTLVANAPVKTLAQQLQHSGSSARREAAEALAYASDRAAILPLVTAAGDKDPSVRVAAIHSLARHAAEPSVLRLLKQLARDTDAKVRIAAAQTLANEKDPSLVSVFLTLLKDENFEVRVAAVWFLSKTRDPLLTSSLVKMLADPDHDVRQTAALALGDLGNRDAIPDLVLALSDVEQDVRKAAETALGKIDPKWMYSEAAGRATSQLEALLEVRPAWVRGAIGHLLAKLRRPELAIGIPSQPGLGNYGREVLLVP